MKSLGKLLISLSLNSAIKMRLKCVPLSPVIIYKVAAMAQELDYLTKVDHLLFHRNSDGYTHTVYSSGGVKISEQTRKRVYSASEPSGMFAPVTRVIFDGSGRQVFHLHLKSPHCGPYMDVIMGSGKPIGYIQRIGCSLFGGFRLNVCDPDGTVILLIENFDNLWKNHDFFISKNDAVVGKICRQNSSEQKIFTLSFPIDLEIEVKVLLIGVFFFLDQLYYRSSSVFFD